MWSHIDPNKPTPLGCLVGFFALVALGLGAIGLIVAWRARGNEKLDAEAVQTLIHWGAGSVVLGIAGLCLAAKLLGMFIDKGPPPRGGGGGLS